METIIQKPLNELEDLWRKENPRPKFTIPDRTEFCKWIVKKIKQSDAVEWDEVMKQYIENELSYQDHKNEFEWLKENYNPPTKKEKL